MVRFGPRHAVAMLVVTGLFWLETSVVVFRTYNVLLPLVSFGLLIIGAYATGFLATIWDIETDDDQPIRPRALPQA